MRDVVRWALSVPFLFVIMLASSMFALDRASMGAIVVFRNVAPLITLAVERMLQWWTEVMPKVAGKEVLVVGPGSLLTGFAAAMLGMRLSRCLSLNLPYAGIGALDAFQNGGRIATWNGDALEG